MRPVTDRDLLARAIAQTALTDRDFARSVLGVDPQTLSNWKRAVRTMDEPTRRLLRAPGPRGRRNLWLLDERAVGAEGVAAK